jgi:hypothetical protein
MRTTGWFAASLASFGITVAGAADGLDLSSRSHAAALESAARMNLPALGRDPLVDHALRIERDEALARSGCRLHDVCYDAADGRVVYRGARRYMPSWHGVEAEGVSLKRDRLVLRYSFR